MNTELIKHDNIITNPEKDLQKTTGITLEDIKIQTFRFKFEDPFISQLSNFAKIHQFDDRVTFKEAWKVWCEDEEIKCIMNEEIKRLYQNGYVGDIIDKMFKSARYYYRKKKETDGETSPRKKYVGFSSTILKAMDDHIKVQLCENIKNIKCIDQIQHITNITPADAYEHFYNACASEIAAEIEHLNQSQDSIVNSAEINDKFKKTYKNRYYNIKVSAQKLP